MNIVDVDKEVQPFGSERIRKVDEGTERKLESRHIQMIAIGGTIGTGLLVTSGSTLASAGALGALIAYVIAGISIFFVVNSLGEMATLIPITGSFNSYAARFVDPALGFACGWIYWLGWVCTFPIELLACSGFLNYWFPDVNSLYFVAIVLIALICLNCAAVGGFGETEYWLSLLKIIAILFFIVTTIYVLIRDNNGLKAYNDAGGPFLGASPGNAVKAVINSMIAASFAFAGTELVGITAGEAKNPRKSIPRAINGTFWRILFFYISCIVLIGFLLPANLPEFQSKEDMVKSPFVIALNRAHIPGVEHIMNFVCFVAVFSAANSTIYGSGRCLMALAQEGQAPKFLSKTRNGVPFAAMAISVAFGCIAFLGNLVGNGIVFNWLVNTTGLGLILTWLMINITHIRFRAAYLAQGYKIEDLPYRALWYPYGTYFGIFTMGATIIISPILVFMPEDGDEEGVVVKFISTFIPIPLFLALYYGWKIYKRTKIVPLVDADLYSSNINLDQNIAGIDYGSDAENDSDVKGWKRYLSFLA